ncbi:MAG: GDP-mannose 4,6-dehydratase [Candidatus Aenigmatarchaeota archaeon]
MTNFDFTGKRVIVTGADGFMGSHLTEKLVVLGAETSIFVRGTSVCGTTQFQLKNIPHLRDKLKHILTGDIACTDTIELIKKIEPEIIFHLAADAYVPKSFIQPNEVTHTNVMGTLNVMHAAKDTNVGQVVVTSSSEIYGTSKEPISEEHELNPTSPYGASKAAADRYALAYHITYGLPIAIIRPFNTYGPRHTYDVIPKFIDLAIHDKPLTIYGSGNQMRDFTYVDDMINAFLIMGSDKRAIGQAINFGTGTDTSIIDIANKVKAISGSKSEIMHVADRTSEVNRLCCDYSKAKRMFGWAPTVSIDEGLKRNIEWARKYRI